MGLPAEKLDQKYTYGDYSEWSDGERWEIIKGDAYNMSPAPLRVHQELLMIFSNELYTFFKGKPCKVYSAPFDVRLTRGDEADNEIDTVVQPDISIICDKSKLDRRGCKGAPDLIVEIVSPGNSSHDMKVKRALYEEFGVKEYWIVLPFEQAVEVYTPDDNGVYKRPDIFGNDEVIKTELFPGLAVDLKKVFTGLEGM